MEFPVSREKLKTLELRVFEEERALLRKEQREPRQVHLPLIDLRLREVGVQRHVGAQA